MRAFCTWDPLSADYGSATDLRDYLTCPTSPPDHTDAPFASKQLYITSPRTTAAAAVDPYGEGAIKKEPAQAKHGPKVSATHSGITPKSSGVAAAAAAAAARSAEGGADSARDPRLAGGTLKSARLRPDHFALGLATLNRTRSDKADAAVFDSAVQDIKKRLAQRYEDKIHDQGQQLHAALRSGEDKDRRIIALLTHNKGLRHYVTNSSKAQAKAVNDLNQAKQDERDKDRAVGVCVRRVLTHVLNSEAWLIRHIDQTATQQKERVAAYAANVREAVKQLEESYQTAIHSSPEPEKTRRRVDSGFGP